MGVYVLRHRSPACGFARTGRELLGSVVPGSLAGQRSPTAADPQRHLSAIVSIT